MDTRETIALDDGVEVRIHQVAAGWSVTLFDTDAQTTFPVVRTYATLDAARQYAATIAGVPS